MKTLKFKTNIKCEGCIVTVTPYLNSLKEAESWNADIQNPDKILTVQGNDDLSNQEIIDVLSKAGYKAEEI